MADATSTRQPKRQRRFRRRLFIGSLCVIAIVVVAVFDWYLRNEEMSQLLRAAARSEAAIVEGDRATREDGGYFGTAPEQKRLREVAYEALVDVKTEGLAVRDVSIMPWHLALRDAQRAHLDYSDAWSSLFDDMVSARYLDTASDIGPTFDTARRAFERALPPVPRRGLADRLDAQFAE